LIFSVHAEREAVETIAPPPCLLLHKGEEIRVRLAQKFIAQGVSSSPSWRGRLGGG